MHVYIYAYTRAYLPVIFHLLILVFEGQHKDVSIFQSKCALKKLNQRPAITWGLWEK